MRNIKLLAVTLVLSAIATIPAFADWKQEADGRWWYENEDGSYPANQWQEIGGKQYYFDGDGYMLANTRTPDGKQVGADGALVQSQSMSNISYSSDSITDLLTVSDYVYVSLGGSTQHFFEITNNSPHTIHLTINETAKDSTGNVIGAGSASQEDIVPGCTVFVSIYFSEVAGISSFDTTFQVKAETSWIPVLQNLSCETSNLGDKIVITVTNNGDIPAEFVKATALFFQNGKVVSQNTAYCVDSDHELKPGSTISKQINSYEKYDSVKVHLTARKSKWR